MKKIVKSFVLILSLVCSSFAFALDYGFVIDDDTTLETNAENKYKFTQKNNANAWIKIPFGKNYDNYITAEGHYRFKYLQDTNVVNHHLDLNLLKVVLYKELDNGSVSANFGRFIVSDATALVFSQNCDGVYLQYDSPFAKFTGYAGYTGLLNANFVSMNNPEDFETPDESLVYALCDKNVIGMLGVGFPNLFARQTLNAQFLGAFRINSISNTRLYATLGLTGPIVGNLFYGLTGTLSFTSYNKQPMNFSQLVKADVNYYFPIGSVGCSAVFAGKNFTGITVQTALESLNEPDYTDLLKVGINGSIKPISNLVIKASGDIAFDGANNYELKGVQYRIGVDYQIVSDVYLGASWTDYYDLNGTDANEHSANVRVKIAL